MALSDALDDESAAGLATEPAATPPKASRKKLYIVAAAALLGLGGLGAVYMTGLTGGLVTHTTEAGSIDLPEIVANLNAGNHRTSFVRIKARLELANKADEAAAKAAQPRLQDLFQTYLRDMRPEELRGSAGTYRLREELTARANIALAPARVTEILFVEMLMQ